VKSYFRALRQVLRLARLVLLAGLVWVGVLAASRFGLITLPEALVGPSVTPAAAAVEAQKVIQNEMTAVKTHDRTLLEASETGPALETDQAAFANPAPLEAAEPFSIVQVAVPHQSGYPARFLAVASTQVGGKGIFGIYSFVKSNARSPWLSDFNVFTDAGQPRPIFRIDPQGWCRTAKWDLNTRLGWWSHWPLVSCRMLWLLFLPLRALLALRRSHRDLALENLALRHQLQVVLRTHPRPRLRNSDRVF
jgi:hypothetical protein